MCKFSGVQHTSAIKVMLGYVRWQPTVILRVAVTVLKVIVGGIVWIVLVLFLCSRIWRLTKALRSSAQLLK